VETTVIATHDMELVSEWADRIIVLHNGNIIADGAREMVFNHKDIKVAGIHPPDIYTMSKILDSDSECFTIQEFVESFGQVI